MFREMSIGKSRFKIAIVLILIGVILRTLLHNNLPSSPSIYININGIVQPMFMLDLFFLVALISLLSGLLLGSYYTFLVPMAIMIITDIIIGNNWILIFTWSGFAMLGLIGYLMKSRDILKIERIPTILGAGVGGVLLYDIWTNFGVWLGGWYSYNFDGLVLCYTMALPFMFWHLLSTTIAISLTIIPIVYLKEHGLRLPEFSIKPYEKKLPFIASALLMVAAIFSVLI